MNKTTKKSKETLAGMLKYSYMVSCATPFKKTIEELAERQNATVGELARAALLLAPSHIIENFPDPDDAPPEDREIIVLKSGANKGRKITRKPRLQVRLTAGYSVETIRRALAFALAIDQGGASLALYQDMVATKSVEPSVVEQDKVADVESSVLPATAPSASAVDSVSSSSAKPAKVSTQLEEQALDFKNVMKTVAFTPLPMGVRTRHDSLYVLGFKSTERPTQRTVKERYKTLARIFHPDSPFGDHQRMSQLNEARNVLAKRPFSVR